MLRSKTLLSTLLLMLAAATAAHAQTVAGDWQGTLAVGPVELRIVLHFAPDGKGGLTGALDSPDQGARGIALSSVTLTGGALSFMVPAIGGSYEGTVNAGATAITGAWRQGGMSAPLNLSRAVATPAAPRVRKPSDVDGDWQGTLDTGAATLRVVLHITTYEDGMTATMDSPDQGATGLPASSITREGQTVRFEMKQIAGSFLGKLDEKLTEIDGTWTQLGNSVRLLLKRVR